MITFIAITDQHTSMSGICRDQNRVSSEYNVANRSAKISHYNTQVKTYKPLRKPKKYERKRTDINIHLIEVPRKPPVNVSAKTI